MGRNFRKIFFTRTFLFFYADLDNKSHDMQSTNTNQSEQNHYSILNCKETATQEEIKQNYQLLVKQYHPDKGETNSDKFILIDKAYKVLRDENKRKDYDANVLEKSCRDQTLIYAEINKNQVSLDEEGLAYHPCRCGESFIITQEFLDDPSECLVECSECSNTILLK